MYTYIRCEGHTWKYGYLSVAASSCHDCSPCRLWWNEEWGSAEGWYGFFCGGGAPRDVCKPPKEATKTCPGGPPPWVSKHIQKLHFDSSSMWTINPIQVVSYIYIYSVIYIYIYIYI